MRSFHERMLKIYSSKKEANTVVGQLNLQTPYSKQQQNKHV